LQPFLGVDKCVNCECLQATLTELLMALEELPVETGREDLLASIREVQDVSNVHGCLGCDPCEPADLLVAFYRRGDAPPATERCGCDPGCPGESSAP
jgi:hypothetical protein